MNPSHVAGILLVFWMTFVGVAFYAAHQNDKILDEYGRKCTAAGGQVFKGYNGHHSAFGCFASEEIKITLEGE